MIQPEDLVSFYSDISPEDKATILQQLSYFNCQELENLGQTYVLKKPEISIPKNMEPVKVYPRNPGKAHKNLYRKAELRGRELVRQGKVAAFLVAGGQGTRLGYDGPKGEYCVTPIKHKPLFQVFAEQLLAYSREGGKIIPWYIMTSEVNHVSTVTFFKENNYFGYPENHIFFFNQGMMPAFSMDGKLLLGSQNSLALSPDGHGGSLRALKKSGALDDMKKRGVEHISYFQVDNPLVHCIDYRFLGLHDLTKSEMSSKTLPKAHPLEKVGNFVQTDGMVQVIEYSDMPEVVARETLANGSLKFNAGSIAIHALRVSFIERLNEGGCLKLPWHRAEKKVAYVNERGELIKPETPNAVKLEQFVFDALPCAKNALVYETDRAEEFSPVKNAEGSDSPESCKAHQLARAARWLQEVGISVPMKNGKPSLAAEIDPLFASNIEQLRARMYSLPLSVKLSLNKLQENSIFYFGRDEIEDLTEGKRIQHSLGQQISTKIGTAVQKIFGKTDSSVNPAGV